MDYTPVIALPVGIKVHTYIHTSMQYHTNPHASPFASRWVSLSFLQTAAGLTQHKSDLWLKLQVATWKMLGVIKLFRGLPMQLHFWCRTHGEAPYHRCLMPSQLHRMKEEQSGFLMPLKCSKYTRPRVKFSEKMK